MQKTFLAGRQILIVEDEPLIALNLMRAFEEVGAVPLSAETLADAKVLVERDGLSGAVLDFGLGDGHADMICHRLDERRIPA